MKKTTIKTEIPEIVRRLSRQTLDTAFLSSLNGSDIYQVQNGWQKEVLLMDADVHVIANGTEFEDAVTAASISSIFVPVDALLTQEVAERILLRNPLSKTIYWEASPDNS